MSQTTDVLLVENRDKTRILTMNRPDKMNALNTALTQRLVHELENAEEDPAVRSVIITGAGRGFCAGADLNEFKELTTSNPQLVRDRAKLTSHLQALPQSLSKPVIAAVNGAAIGGGAGIALSCDLFFAAEGIKFGYPEVKHSIVPALVMTSLERHFPRKVALELILTGRLMQTTELEHYGLVNKVLAPELLVDHALEVASGFAHMKPETLDTIKSLYYRVGDLPQDAAIRLGRDVNTMMRSFRD